MKTAACYIRVSTDDQTEYSPDSQLKLIQEYAEKHQIALLEDFIFSEDGGKSGKNMSKRAEFLKMISAARQIPKPFDIILVWKFSRFARNQEESIVVKSRLKKLGIEVISISEVIPDGQFGSLIERIIEWSDEYYLTNLSQEVKRGMAEKVSRGEPVCAPPFGYDIKDNTYIPNSDAVIVQNIFNDYLSGVGMRTLAVKYAAMGIKTKYGNPPDNRYIEYMLRNPVYIGKLRWSRDGRTVSRRKFDDQNIIVVDGKHKPIISLETFDAVQEKIADVKRKYVKYRRSSIQATYMLKGLLRCNTCGATLVLTVNGYQCCNYARGSCNVSHNISEGKINSALISYLEQLTVGGVRLNPTFSSLPVREGKINYDSLIQNEQKKLVRIKKAYSEGVDTLSEYKQQKAQILAQIERLESDSKKETAENSSEFAAVSDEKFKKSVVDVLGIVKDEKSPSSAKNAALQSLIEKVVLFRPDEHIEVFFHPIS